MLVLELAGERPEACPGPRSTSVKPGPTSDSRTSPASGDALAAAGNPTQHITHATAEHGGEQRGGRTCSMHRR